MVKSISATEPFRFRLNCIDHYQLPATFLDPHLPSPQASTQVREYADVEAPVIRVFGATETGQKVCALIHGAFPYLYLAYDGSLDTEAISIYVKLLTSSINHALALSYRRNPFQGPQISYVAFISVVKAIPFYGYHVGYQVFLKVYLRNPAHMTRFADLLAEGVILAKVLQPYESHMQYIAQWMCDYNLYGCAYLDCEQVSFRSPLPSNQSYEWSQSVISTSDILDSITFPKQTHCDLEVDIQVHHILNRTQIKDRNIHRDFGERFFKPGPEYKFVPSMASLWKDEANRRKRRMGLENSDKTPFPPEALVTMSADPRLDRGHWIHEEEYFRAVQDIIDKEKESVDRERITFEIFIDNGPDLTEIQTATDSVKEFYPENLSSTLANDSFPHILEECLVDESLLIDGSNLLDLPPQRDDTSAESTQARTPKKRKRIVDYEEPTARVSQPLNSHERKLQWRGRQGDSPIKNNKTPSGTQTSIDSSMKVSKGNPFGNGLKKSDEEADLFMSSPLGPMQSKEKGLDATYWIAKSTPISIHSRRGAKEYQLRKMPPAPKSSMSIIIQRGGPATIQQDAFYSDEIDVPNLPQELMNREFKVQSKTTPYLPEFDKTAKSLASFGENPLVSLSKLDLDAMFLKKRKSCTLRTWQIAIPPPPSKSVKEWLQQPKNIKPISNKAVRSNIKKSPNDQVEGPTMLPNDLRGSHQRTQTSVAHQTQYMTIMSVEVHVNSRKDLNPDPAEDEISSIFWSIKTDSDDPDGSSLSYGIVALTSAFTPKDSFSKLGETTVMYETHELEVLNTFVSVVRDFDPDILTGYEVHNGSWGYLIDRAKLKYEIDLPVELSRVRSDSTSRKDIDRWGLTTTSTIRITGRHTFNIWRTAQGEMNYLQYTLENVVFRLLGKRIPHHSFQQLTTWYNSRNPRLIAKVLKYFLLRVQLNIRVLDKMEIVAKTSEQARLLGVDFFAVVSRGSQFKVESLMFRIAKPENFILISPSRKQVGQQNALECLPLVMEPRSNFYPSPMLVLDFQSLYPSIMIAYNYCYSTCLGRVVDWRGTNKLGFVDHKREPGILELLQKNINISPNGLVYVRPEIRRSLLAKMLAEILETRVMVKSGMKQDKDDQILQKLLHNRQLALKLIANVTYGYTSASFSGRMPCAEIADSIVQTARETLEKAIAMIHSVKKWDAEVVYGDTDSLFIYLKNRTREQAFVIGKEIADTITKANPRPVKLKFEKVYQPCVLLAKKRYVGFKYESADQKVPEFDAKGIETVRRDGTPAEQKIEEKALKILFRTHDLSKVKRYFQEQCIKIMTGRVSIQDFLFAREVRLGTYSDNGVPPAGVMIATRKMQQDHRKEPQYGERVPYLVIAGAPGARLIDRCVDPGVLLEDDQVELDSEYYIGKNIVPPLERIFNLAGANVRAWYDEIPKTYRLRSVHNLPVLSAAETGAGATYRKTLETYLNENTCFACGDSLSEIGKGDKKKKQPRVPLCDECKEDPSAAIYGLRTQMQTLESRLSKIHNVCRSCEGIAFSDTITCDSRDCPTFYSRVRYNSQFERLRNKARVLVEIE
jgi:DNA polymerase zeta